MTKVLILLSLPPSIQKQYLDGVRQRFPDVSVDLIDHISKIDPHLETMNVMIGFGPHLRDRADHVFAQAKSLKWVQALGTGVDNITDRPTLRGDVIVTNIRGIHGGPMTEAALMAMLALSRDLPRLVRNQDRHAWDRWPARLIDGKTVGIFGIGAISEVLAPRCKAMGMEVVGFSSAPRKLDGFDRVYSRDEIVARAGELDFLVLLTPYTKETHHLIGANVFAAMKPTAFLVNLARGGVADEDALLAALRDKTIAGAALDVFVKEPLPEDHPFWTLDNVLISPHTGGFNVEYAGQALAIIEENMRHFLAGETDKMIFRVER
jgi:D-2-hydroxyacid dehydrogenase (NADP+)